MPFLRLRAREFCGIAIVSAQVMGTNDDSLAQLLALALEELDGQAPCKSAEKK